MTDLIVARLLEAPSDSVAFAVQEQEELFEQEMHLYEQWTDALTDRYREYRALSRSCSTRTEETDCNSSNESSDGVRCSWRKYWFAKSACLADESQWTMATEQLLDFVDTEEELSVPPILPFSAFTVDIIHKLTQGGVRLSGTTLTEQRADVDALIFLYCYRLQVMLHLNKNQLERFPAYNLLSRLGPAVDGLIDSIVNGRQSLRRRVQLIETLFEQSPLSISASETRVSGPPRWSLTLGTVGLAVVLLTLALPWAVHAVDASPNSSVPETESTLAALAERNPNEIFSVETFRSDVVQAAWWNPSNLGGRGGTLVVPQLNQVWQRYQDRHIALVNKMRSWRDIFGQFVGGQEAWQRALQQLDDRVFNMLEYASLLQLRSVYQTVQSVIKQHTNNSAAATAQLSTALQAVELRMTEVIPRLSVTTQVFGRVVNVLSRGAQSADNNFRTYDLGLVSDIRELIKAQIAEARNNRDPSLQQFEDAAWSFELAYRSSSNYLSRAAPGGTLLPRDQLVGLTQGFNVLNQGPTAIRLLVQDLRGYGIVTDESAAGSMLENLNTAATSNLLGELTTRLVDMVSTLTLEGYANQVIIANITGLLQGTQIALEHASNSVSSGFLEVWGTTAVRTLTSLGGLALSVGLMFKMIRSRGQASSQVSVNRNFIAPHLIPAPSSRTCAFKQGELVSRVRARVVEFWEISHVDPSSCRYKATLLTPTTFVDAKVRGNSVQETIDEQELSRPSHLTDIQKANWAKRQQTR